MKLVTLLFGVLMPVLHAFSCSGIPQTFTEGSDFKVEVMTFRPEKPKSIVLILPPTGGINIIDKSYAKGLCERGHEVHILTHWSDDDEFNYELEIHNRFYARSYRAIGLVLKNMRTDLKIGVLGTSVGGIFASIAASRYPQITSAMIITSGAHIPSIIANSNQLAMVDAWNVRRKRYGFKNKTEYIEALEKVIDLEPLNRLTMTTPKRFGLIIATEDKTVPTVNQERLKALWKPETVFYRKNGHFWGIVLTWLFDSEKIFSFFQE